MRTSPARSTASSVPPSATGRPSAKPPNKPTKPRPWWDYEEEIARLKFSMQSDAAKLRERHTQDVGILLNEQVKLRDQILELSGKPLSGTDPEAIAQWFAAALASTASEAQGQQIQLLEKSVASLKAELHGAKMAAAEARRALEQHGEMERAELARLRSDIVATAGPAAAAAAGASAGAPRTKAAPPARVKEASRVGGRVAPTQTGAGEAAEELAAQLEQLRRQLGAAEAELGASRRQVRQLQARVPPEGLEGSKGASVLSAAEAAAAAAAREAQQARDEKAVAVAAARESHEEALATLQEQRLAETAELRRKLDASEQARVTAATNQARVEGMLEAKVGEAQSLTRELETTKGALATVQAQADAEAARIESRHADVLKRLKEGEGASRRAADSRMQQLAAEQLRALEEADGTMTRLRKQRGDERQAAAVAKAQTESLLRELEGLDAAEAASRADLSRHASKVVREAQATAARARDELGAAVAKLNDATEAHGLQLERERQKHRAAVARLSGEAEELRQQHAAQMRSLEAGRLAQQAGEARRLEHHVSSTSKSDNQLRQRLNELEAAGRTTAQQLGEANAKLATQEAQIDAASQQQKVDNVEAHRLRHALGAAQQAQQAAEVEGEAMALERDRAEAARVKATREKDEAEAQYKGSSARHAKLHDEWQRELVHLQGTLAEARGAHDVVAREAERATEARFAAARAEQEATLHAVRREANTQQQARAKAEATLDVARREAGEQVTQVRELLAVAEATAEAHAARSATAEANLLEQRQKYERQLDAAQEATAATRSEWSLVEARLRGEKEAAIAQMRSELTASRVAHEVDKQTAKLELTAERERLERENAELRAMSDGLEAICAGQVRAVRQEWSREKLEQKIRLAEAYGDLDTLQREVKELRDRGATLARDVGEAEEALHERAVATHRLENAFAAALQVCEAEVASAREESDGLEAALLRVVAEAATVIHGLRRDLDKEERERFKAFEREQFLLGVNRELEAVAAVATVATDALAVELEEAEAETAAVISHAETLLFRAAQREQATSEAAEREVEIVREQLQAQLEDQSRTAYERQQLRERQAERTKLATEQKLARAEAEAERIQEAREMALRVSAASLEARAALVSTQVTQTKAFALKASGDMRHEKQAFAVGVAALGAELAASELATYELTMQRATAAAQAAQLQRQLGQSEFANDAARGAAQSVWGPRLRAVQAEAEQARREAEGLRRDGATAERENQAHLDRAEQQLAQAAQKNATAHRQLEAAERGLATMAAQVRPLEKRVAQAEAMLEALQQLHAAEVAEHEATRASRMLVFLPERGTG